MHQNRLLQPITYVQSGNILTTGCTITHVNTSLLMVPPPPIVRPAHIFVGSNASDMYKLDINIKDFSSGDKDFRKFKKSTRADLGLKDLLAYIDHMSINQK